MKSLIARDKCTANGGAFEIAKMTSQLSSSSKLSFDVIDQEAEYTVGVITHLTLWMRITSKQQKFKVAPVASQKRA